MSKFYRSSSVSAKAEIRDMAAFIRQAFYTGYYNQVRLVVIRAIRSNGLEYRLGNLSSDELFKLVDDADRECVNNGLSSRPDYKDTMQKVISTMVNHDWR